MMNAPPLLAPLVAVLLLAGSLAAQPRGENPPPRRSDRGKIPDICDGCRSGETLSRRWLLASVSKWGYGYDSLLADLDRWRSSPYVTIDSVGASVQNRALWELTITSPYQSSIPRRTIFIHARTHPGEVQALYVTREMIRFLIADNDYARMLRERTVFHIIPMYNPDGVELELPRQNAHNIDLERNWEAVPPEPEVATLRRRFQELMASPMPIEVALNMHSASDCKRYFVYHDTAGTSPEFTALEQQFITGVGSFFPGGIEPWSYDVRWSDVPLTNFPESWWWMHYGARVMALTYEDMNCGAAGSYDSTAQAILRGIALYLRLDLMSGVAAVANPSSSLRLLGNYPNPVRTSTTIRYALPFSAPVRMVLYDMLGEELAVLANEWQTGGEHEVIWQSQGAPAGAYLYTLTAGNVTRTGTLIVAR